MWWRMRSVGDTRTGTGVGPSFEDLPVLKGTYARRSFTPDLGRDLGFDREGDAAVVADIAHLAVLGKVGGHDLVAIKAGPYHGHLGAAVRVQGHQVSQC